MSIHFPDLQVLLPRAEEIARVGSIGQQQDFHQHILAQAALARTERERNRVARTVEGERAGKTDKEKAGGKQTMSHRHRLPHPKGKGDRLDIEA